ncbi:MAG: nitrilase [Proteobacteria bacterium]|nr:nitrilase [Pseudomonadota bacterium]
MKVAVFQTSPKLLDLETNVEDVIGKIHRGKEQGADLIAFPELALTGYFVGQRYHEASLRMDSREVARLAEASKGTAAVVGFIEESQSMNFYNSALVLIDGHVQFAYRKLNLPNYGVFEERKYFSPGKRVPVFRLHGFAVAVFICNDLWHPSLPYLGVCQKADIFVTVFNSSQGSMGTEFSNIESWEIINKFYSRIFGIYNICSNRVGEESLEVRNSAQGNKHGRLAALESPDPECVRTTYDFWGGSEIVNPFGQVIVKAPYHEEAEIYADVDRDLLRQKRILLPYLRNDDPYFTQRALDQILYGKSPGV